MRHSKIKITAGLVAFMATFGSLQAQTVKYTTENKLHDLAPAKVSLSFFNFENFITPITAGLMVEGQAIDRLYYNAQARLGYLRILAPGKETMETTHKESKGSYFEGGVEFAFYDKDKPSRYRVVTSSSSNGYSTTEKSFKGDCEKRVSWSLSGGLFNYTRPSYIKGTSDLYVVSNGNQIKPTGENAFNINLSTTGTFIGLTHRKVKKAIFHVNDGYAYRRFYSRRFYLHALIGNTNMQDITLKSGQSVQIDNAKMDALGYRMGFQWDEMGVITTFEIGKVPTATLDVPNPPEDFILYKYYNNLKLTFNFAIFNNDKNYHLRLKK